MTLDLAFLGAAGFVTGSRYLLETRDARVLVDCGLFQERANLGRNWGDFGFVPSALDSILLTHGHLDHCGLLPKLVREGFGGPVYCSAATADLVPIILRDSARIQTEDAAAKARRHADEGRSGPHPPLPLYGVDDAERAIRLLRPVEDPGKPLAVAPGIEAVWGENGHILGASWIGVSAAGKRVVFSGDVGCWGRPILNDPLPPRQADCLVIESTYGDRVRPDADAGEMLREAFDETAARGGNLLIPSFSVERAQELLYLLSRLGEKGRLGKYAVYLDSPMASRVTELFARHPEICDEDMLGLLRAGKSPFDFAGLHYVSTAGESRRLNAVRGGAVIIAGNGMCTGGRIKHHLLHNIERPEATLLFVGFQAPGTLGRQLADGAKEVRLFNRRVRVRAAVKQIFGLSGHADRDELLRWVDGLEQPPRHCFVTHGTGPAAAALAERLGGRRGWSVSVPALGERRKLA